MILDIPGKSAIFIGNIDIMGLSRIWTAFIIIALLAATGKLLFQPGQEQLFSLMVTGKNSDTVSVRVVDSLLVPSSVNEQLATQKVAVWGKEKVVKEGTAYIKHSGYYRPMVYLKPVAMP